MRAYVGLILAGLLGAAEAAADPSYRLAATLPLGAPDHWDCLAFDPATARLFVAHGSEVTVVDTKPVRIAGRVDGLAGAHGVVVVPGGHGYVASGNAGTVTVFDPASLAVLGTVAAQPHADALAYDPSSRKLNVMNSGSGSITVIDTGHDRAIATIAAGGDLEFADSDGRGQLFVNQVDTDAVLRVDMGTNAVTATWPLPGCTAPHGIAIDRALHRIFSSCENANVTVTDAATGKILAQPAIGHGSDGVVLDAARHLIFSSNGDGTLSLVDSVSMKPVGSVATARGARTMAEDPSSGRVFLVTADVGNGAAVDAHKLSFVPGTVKLLVYDPVSGVQ